MLHTTNVPRSVPSGVFSGFICEHSEQASVAGVEVEVILIRLAQVGLLEEERHAQHALPEINRTLLRGSNDGDVVDALYLSLLHGLLRFGFVLRSSMRPLREVVNRQGLR